MKKTLAILIALALVVSAASAQVVIKGSLKLGMHYATSSDVVALEDGSITSWTDNVANPKFDPATGKGDQQANVSFAYTNGDAGMKINMRFKQFDNAALKNFYSDVAFVWAKFLDKKVYVLYGLTEDNTFRTETTYFQPNVRSGTGLMVQFVPAAGLTLGLYAETPAGKMDATANAVGMTTEQFTNEIGFAAMYSNDMMTFKAGLKMDSDYDTNKDAFGVATLADEGMLAYVGFNYKAIKALKLVTGIQFWNIGAETQAAIQSETVIEYAVTEVAKVGINVGNTMYTGDAKDTPGYAGEIYFMPYVTYSVNPSTALQLEGYYSMNEDGFEKITDFYIEPRVTYTMSDTAKIAGYVNYYVNDFSDEVGKSAVTYIGVDFLYSF